MDVVQVYSTRKIMSMDGLVICVRGVRVMVHTTDGIRIQILFRESVDKIKCKGGDSNG